MVPARGSLIRFFEYYGSNPEDMSATTIGIKLGCTDSGAKHQGLEALLVANGWVRFDSIAQGRRTIQSVSVEDQESDSIEVKMAKEGIRWTDRRTRGPAVARWDFSSSAI
jgi:hypothetical protein